MKKTHYKKAIDRLFEKWPWETGFDPERDIESITIMPAIGEEGDTDQYAHLEISCLPENYMYGSPKVITVDFNLSKQ